MDKSWKLRSRLLTGRTGGATSLPGPRFVLRWRRGALLLLLLTAALGLRVGWRQAADAAPRAEDLPDLRFVTEWPGWTYDRPCLGRQHVLRVAVENRGRAAAGPFAVRDGAAAWFVEGLEPGQRLWLEDWGKYPLFPLVVDPFDQVPESNEGNNLLGPSPRATWTPTPRFAAPAGSAAGAARRARPGPDRPLTAPPPSPCPTRTPVPTLTPAGAPALPDLLVVDSTWEERPVLRQDGLCLPLDGGRYLTVVLRNQGRADAGAFMVRGGVGGVDAAWRVAGIAAGAEFTLAARPRSLPQELVVDADDEVEEAREDNNRWLPPRNGTPTAVFTPPAFCRPTISPTPIPTDALPDLTMARLYWDRDDFGRPACLGPLRRLEIIVRNDGRSPSGPFEVKAGNHVWFFDGIGPLAEATNEAGPANWVTWPIHIDSHEQVPESDEDDNLVWPDRTLTATPTGTPPPTCSPTVTPGTPVAVATTVTPSGPSPSPAVTRDTPTVGPADRVRILLPGLWQDLWRPPTATSAITPTIEIGTPGVCPEPRRICEPCPGCTATPEPLAGTPTVCPFCRHRR